MHLIDKPRQKPSRLRRQECEAKVTGCIRLYGPVNYTPVINPYPRDTPDAQRFERLYNKRVQSFRVNDAWFKDLCEVYGTDLSEPEYKPLPTS